MPALLTFPHDFFFNRLMEDIREKKRKERIKKLNPLYWLKKFANYVLGVDFYL